MPRTYRWLEPEEVRTDDGLCDCGQPAVLVALGCGAPPSQLLLCGPCANAEGVFGRVHRIPAYTEAP